jgi:hypothetical protein
MSTVIAYSEPNYSGTAYVLDAGPQVITPRISVSSIQIPLGWDITLYTGDDFTGQTATVTQDQLELGPFLTSSVVVRARAVFYRINARHSNKSLDVSHASQDDRAHVIQYTPHDDDNQSFLLLRDDGGLYTICAKHSGKVLDVALNPTPGLIGHIIQYRSHAGNNQKFRLRPSDGNFRIETTHSGKVWDIAGADTANSAHLIEYRWKEADNQRFSLEALHTQLLPVRQGRELNDIGDVPRMTSFASPPDQGHLSLIGEKWIPYLLVNDGERSDQLKIAESPFYRLSRYGFWKLLYYFDFDAGVDLEREFTYEVGLTVGTTRQTEETLNFTFGLKGTILYFEKWVKNELTASLSYTMKWTTTTEIVEARKETRRERRRYPAGPRMAEAAWARADLYVLNRMDGSEVVRWQEVDGDAAILDRWP